MKILLIHQYFKEDDVTGGARFNEMTRIWKELGHDITVIAGNLDGQSSSKRPEYRGKFVNKKVQNGMEVWRCNVSEAYNVNFLGRLWGYFSFVISGTYAAIFKVKGNFDVILVTSPPLFVGIIAFLASKIKKTPFVFEVRDLWPESAIDTGVLKNRMIIKFAFWFERFIYKKAAMINVLTPAFLTTLLVKKEVSSEKLIMIPNAADFALSDDLLATFDREAFRQANGFDGKFVITYVGAHGVANGLEQVLSTAERMKDTNVLFVLVGAGMQKQKLIEIASTNKITNVKFYDPVPKKEVLKFILASEMGASVLLKNDAFKTVYSNKTFDYMSCKTPILMAIDGVSKELVEEADAGVFVEPENPADFEAKIRYYMNKKEEITRQGLNGFQYAKQHFDRDVLAKKYLNYLLKFSK
jgi:glycosyltransferase involved in cell wall biosynthesis